MEPHADDHPQAISYFAGPELPSLRIAACKPSLPLGQLRAEEARFTRGFSLLIRAHSSPVVSLHQHLFHIDPSSPTARTTIIGAMLSPLAGCMNAFARVGNTEQRRRGLDLIVAVALNTVYDGRAGAFPPSYRDCRPTGTRAGAVRPVGYYKLDNPPACGVRADTALPR